MQAIILAAGKGSRLKDKTVDTPKALISVNGTPLLIRTLNILAEYEIEEVIIVVGYLKEKIKQEIGNKYKNIKITFVDNDKYDCSNNIYSLYLTKDYINEDCLLIECDLYFSKKIISSIINQKADCSIMVSKYNKDTMNGTVITFNASGDVTDLIVKSKQEKIFNYSNKYKTVNIYKFSKDFFLKKYIPNIATYTQTESMNSYYELVLGGLIYYNNSNIKAVVVDESLWREIDDENDLKIAEGTKWDE